MRVGTGQRARPVGTGQLEGAKALQGPPKGGVLAHALAEAEAAGRLGQVDVEPVTPDVEPVGEAAE